MPDSDLAHGPQENIPEDMKQRLTNESEGRRKTKVKD
jgi:hypothetical protein